MKKIIVLFSTVFILSACANIQSNNNSKNIGSINTKTSSKNFLTSNSYKKSYYSPWLVKNVVNKFGYKEINKYAKQGLNLLASNSKCRRDITFLDILPRSFYNKNISSINNINQVRLVYTCNVMDSDKYSSGIGHIRLTVGQIKDNYEVKAAQPAVDKSIALKRCSVLVDNKTARNKSLNLGIFKGYSYSSNQFFGTANISLNYKNSAYNNRHVNYTINCSFPKHNSAGHLHMSYFIPVHGSFMGIGPALRNHVIQS